MARAGPVSDHPPESDVDQGGDSVHGEVDPADAARPRLAFGGAGPVTPDELGRELRWSLAQVAFLLHLEECSDERIQGVRERVHHLAANAQYVMLADHAAWRKLVGELGRAAEALRAVNDLQKNDARDRIKEAEDRLSSALGVLDRVATGAYTDEPGRVSQPHRDQSEPPACLGRPGRRRAAATAAGRKSTF